MKEKLDPGFELSYTSKADSNLLGQEVAKIVTKVVAGWLEQLSTWAVAN